MHRRTTTIAIAIVGALLTTFAASAPAAAVDSIDGVAVEDCRIPTPQSDLNEGFPVSEQALAPRGELKAAMIFVDFPDHPAAPDSLDAHRDNLLPGVEFLNTLSEGQLDLQPVIAEDWARMPKPSTEYPFDRGISYEQHIAYVRDAVAAADANFDFSDIDIVWVVATDQAPNITYSPTTNFAGIEADGNSIGHAVTFGYDQWRWGGLVLAHESGHTFGLPDLYSFAEVDGEYHSFVGGWDVEGLISGPAPEYTAWHRWLLGWIGDDQVECIPSGVVTDVRLEAVETTGGTKMAVVKTGENQALVVESRKALRYDSDAVSTGALLYTIDTSVRTGEGPLNIIDALPGYNPIPEGRHQLDDAAFQIGQTFTDETSGTTVEVTASDATGDTVRIDTGGETPREPVTPAPDATAPGPGPELAATGVDASPLAGTMIALLLGAAALGTIARARRRDRRAS